MRKNFSEAQEKILAIETTGRSFGLALALAGDPPVVKAELAFDVGMKHSEILKESCVFLLRHCGWDKKDLTLLAVSTGPGSFTGLRVGISFARALAQALSIPLIGVPSFESIAAGIRRTGGTPLAVLIDSIGGDVFYGRFDREGCRPMEPYRARPLPELLQELSGLPNVFLAGEGFLRHEKEIRDQLGRKILSVSQEENFPRAGILAGLALEKAKRTRPGKDSWKKIFPFYLRPPVAVERLNYRRKEGSAA